MSLNHKPSVDGSAREASSPRAGLPAWTRLLLGAVLFVLFLAAANFAGRHIPILRAWGRGVDYYGLRPSAIYYTDYEASGDAEALIRNSLEYPPQARK